MSGHSHFATIKHKKAATDAKRSKEFSKLANEIAIATRDGGGEDLSSNYRLRLVVEKAHDVNMPQENIERAIKRGMGAGEGASLQSVLFEAYGPAGIAILISGITDNKNRTLGEIKQILASGNGKLVAEGAVRWMFEQLGVLIVDKENISLPKEEAELIIIDSAAKDFTWSKDGLEIRTSPTELGNVKTYLEQKGIKIASASLDWVPKEEVQIAADQKEAAEKLFEALDENDSVQEIFSNLAL